MKRFRIDPGESPTSAPLERDSLALACGVAALRSRASDQPWVVRDWNSQVRAVFVNGVPVWTSRV